jgi:hypothetical protein
VPVMNDCFMPGIFIRRWTRVGRSETDTNPLASDDLESIRCQGTAIISQPAQPVPRYKGEPKEPRFVVNASV